jgi:hypothetical protein
LTTWRDKRGLSIAQVHEKLTEEHFTDGKIPALSTFYAQLSGNSLKIDTIMAVEDICFNRSSESRRKQAEALFKKARDNPTLPEAAAAENASRLRGELDMQRQEMIAAQGKQIELLERNRVLTEAVARSDALVSDTQQFVHGLMWATSEIERELVQVTHERNILRAGVRPEEGELAAAQARIAVLEKEQKELGQQLAQARHERDEALAVSENLRRELFTARANGTAANPGDDASSGLAMRDDLFGPTTASEGHSSMLEQLRQMSIKLAADRQDLRKAAANAGFSTENPQKPAAEMGVEDAAPAAGGQRLASSGTVARQPGDVDRLQRAVEIATLATPQDRFVASIRKLREDGAERAIEAQLFEVAREEGSERVGGASAVFDFVQALMADSPADAERLLEAMGAVRSIAEIRPHLRRHADTKIGLHFLRGMALERPGPDLSRALHYLRKGSMATDEDRDLASRVVKIIAEFATDRRVEAVLQHLTRSDRDVIMQFRQHRQRNAKIGKPKSVQVTVVDDVRPEERKVIKGQVIQKREQPQ